MAQSVEPPTAAQVMISQLVGSSPSLGSVLTAQSLEPASNSVSPSLSAPPLLSLCLLFKKMVLKRVVPVISDDVPWRPDMEILRMCVQGV